MDSEKSLMGAEVHAVKGATISSKTEGDERYGP